MAITETEEMWRAAQHLLKKHRRYSGALQIHEYRAANGRLIYFKLRAYDPNTDEKLIRPMRPNGGGFEQGEPSFGPEGKPLYGLPALAQHPYAEVIVCEGENCADALAKLGCVATTSGAASSAAAADWRPLAGRSVLIWPDHDEAGARYADDVAARLIELGCTVRVIDAAALGLDDKGDAVDWLRAHPSASSVDVLALPSQDRAGASDATDGWDEPAELLDALPAVEPLPMEALPPSLGAFVADVADRMQCPPDFVAVPLIVALGSVLGRQIAIAPKRSDNWTEHANLWGCIVGNPGVLKTPAMNEALRPLHELELAAFKDFEGELANWKRDRVATEIRASAAKQRATKDAKHGNAFDVDAMLIPDQKEPEPRRYVVNDATVEALGDVLIRSPNGVLAYRDELAGLVRSFDRPGHEGARGFYLSGFTGKESYTFDRIGRGKNLRIEAVCLSVLGSIQPAILSECLREAAEESGGDGMMSRFSLLVWPDVTRKWRNVDRQPDAQATRRVGDIFERFDLISAACVGATERLSGVPVLRFDDEAQALFDAWRETFELESRSAVEEGEHPSLVAHWQKYRKLVPALALIFHLAECDEGGPVRVEALRFALAWHTYLKSHARRAYAGVITPEMRGARELLRRIQSGGLKSPFRAREVYRNGWRNLATPAAVGRAINVLMEYGWLRSAPSPQGNRSGRPTESYEVHPKILCCEPGARPRTETCLGKH